jgi:hypothetical protein
MFDVVGAHREPADVGADRSLAELVGPRSGERVPATQARGSAGRAPAAFGERKKPVTGGQLDRWVPKKVKTFSQPSIACSGR